MNCSRSGAKAQPGRIARQITFGPSSCWFGRSVAFIDLFEVEPQSSQAGSFGGAGGCWRLGCWIAYRLVNLPSFADFLIAVEAEMNKVSWPTRTELFRSSLVVIFSILFLAAVLFAYDLFWRNCSS